jgi:tRNA pseudouridine65 synthase
MIGAEADMPEAAAAGDECPQAAHALRLGQWPSSRRPEALPVVWRDEHYAVVYKPAGMPVHRTPSIDVQPSEVALQVLRGQLGCHVYPVHRLDRPTAGLVLFALASHAVEPVARLFRAERVRKRYLAVIRGWIPTELFLQTPLIDIDGDSNPHGAPGWRDGIEAPRPAARGVAGPGTGAGAARAIPRIPRPARTRVRPLATVEVPHAVGRYPSARYALVEVRPLTGRRHQVRRHLQRDFHPILGDTTYGDGRHNRFLREHYATQRLLLCGVGLAFTHPYTQQALDIHCAPDAELLRILVALGWSAQVRELIEAQAPPRCDDFAPARLAQG